MKTETPWGPAQHCEEVGRGIEWYSTASHGGYYVDFAKRELPSDIEYYILKNQRNPFHNDMASGWFEEDCNWALVAVSFPLYFTDKEIDSAWKIIERVHPDLYAMLEEEANFFEATESQ